MITMIFYFYLYFFLVSQCYFRLHFWGARKTLMHYFQLNAFIVQYNAPHTQIRVVNGMAYWAVPFSVLSSQFWQ